MFYVSSFNRAKGLYGVTDTDDGAVDWFSKEVLIDIVKSGQAKINGVSGNQVSIVSLTNQVMNVGFGKIEKQVDALIDGWDLETCKEVGRSGHFVSKLKGLSLPEARRVTKSYVYPDSIRDAVKNAAQYTNQIKEVDVTDRTAVMQALARNVCLVLQHKTTGTLTSFVCSGGISVLDFAYAPGFFDAVYLTKQLYGYTYDIAKVRPKRQSSTPKNPDLLNVFSCSLRFRNDGVRHDKGEMVLSSPFYTVNLSRLFCMYILDNPASLGDTILPEFQRSQHIGTYNFDFAMFQQVMNDVRNGVNTFCNVQSFMQYINPANIPANIQVQELVDRYKSDFGYMGRLRTSGMSFAQK